MNKFDRRQYGLAALAILAAAASGCSGGGSGTSFDGPPGNPGGSNSAPTISGTPALNIVVDQTYEFTPTASDADGDALTFAISNQPSWSTFDTSTGTLSGTPIFGETGSYSSIVISVTDGNANSSLPQFTIEVADVGNLSVTLSWTPPTENMDDSPLLDLSAYKFYFGLSAGSYPNEIIVDNPGLSSYTVLDLTSNTYYFVMTAVNRSGAESEFSNVAVWNP